MRINPAKYAFGGAVVYVAALGIFTPIGAGLWHSARAALGYVPALGLSGPSLAPFAEVLGAPGFATALQRTLITGFAATLISLLLALALAAVISHRHARLQRIMAPFLAVPHAALAVGLAFVLAPSGWMARALAPFVGWVRPPEIASVNDAFGLALTLGLVIKEMPFLLLAILAALTQLPMRAHFATGQSLGYGHGAIWAKIIFPQLWPLVRLPVYVVLVYGLSVVDMALILGPSHPPTAAVMVARLFSSPDLSQILPASAGATLLGAICGASLVAVWIGERAIARIGRKWIGRGRRNDLLGLFINIGAALGVGLLAIGAIAMLSLGLWSFAWRWAWPMLLPESFSLLAWARFQFDFGSMLANTALIALLSTALSLALAIAWLETHPRSRFETLIYLPLLIPQISFLFGMNTLLLDLGGHGTMGAVIWAHCIFVFPYMMIALSGPWRALDSRYCQTAASLGATRWRQVWAVKLPILLAPICAAVAIGVAVSVSQYLPTLFLGAGRISTLTTQAVTLASSSDRRIIGVVTSLQTLLPFVAFLAAFLIPRIAFRNRRALQGPLPCH